MRSFIRGFFKLIKYGLMFIIIKLIIEQAILGENFDSISNIIEKIEHNIKIDEK